YEINNYAAFYNLNQRQKIALLPYYLEGSASTWWESIRTADNVPLTWAGTENKIKEEFLPRNYINRLRTQLYNLKQTHSVASYSSAFRQILLCLPKMEESLVVHLYIQGLKNATKLEVEMKDPETLNEAEVQALRVDDVRFGKTNMKQTPRPNKPNGNLNNIN